MFWAIFFFFGLSFSSFEVEKDYVSFSFDSLKQCVFNASDEKTNYYLDFLNIALTEFEFDDVFELALFSTVLNAETKGFKVLEELSDGTRLLNAKVDLCLKTPFDAYLYRPRGGFKIVGKCEYEEAGDYFGVDFLNDPFLIKDEPYLFRTSLWKWRRLFPKGTFPQPLDGPVFDFSEIEIFNNKILVEDALQSAGHFVDWSVEDLVDLVCDCFEELGGVVKGSRRSIEEPCDYIVCCGNATDYR